MSSIKAPHLKLVKQLTATANEMKRLAAIESKIKTLLKEEYGNGVFTGGGYEISLTTQSMEIADTKALRESPYWERFSSRVERRVLTHRQIKAGGK